VSRVFKNKGTWWIDYCDALGRRHRRKVGPDKRVATEALNATLTKVARREWVGVVEDSAITFADFCDDVWSKRILGTVRPNTAQRWRGAIENHLKPFFTGGLRAVELGRVEHYIAQRIAAGANVGTVNRELGALKHILRRASKWTNADGDPYLRQYPLQDLKSLKDPAGRVRFLEGDELNRLLLECDRSQSKYLKAFVLIALNGGMRRGEILNLQRRDVDWVRRTAMLPLTKNGSARVVHLNQVAFEALRSLPVRIDGRLFPYNDKSASTVSHAFHNACARAGIKDFRLHDCRHHFASTHAMAGTNARILQALLGHRDPRMTMRYSHLSDRSIEEAANRIAIGAVEPSAPAEEANQSG
jgi:integrase